MKGGPIIWEAWEYEDRERSTDWYWAMGIIAFSVFLITIILGNYVFALMLAVCAFALYAISRNKPRRVEIELNHRGLRIENEFWLYSDLRSFWVEDNDHGNTGVHSRLYFRPRGAVAPLLIISLENAQPQEIRNYLLHLLLEEEHVEPVAHRIMHFLGF